MNIKNMLFISPEFFGIERNIINEMKRQGINVIFANERAVTSSIDRALNKVLPSLFYKKSNNYYIYLLEKINHELDVILIVKGDMVTPFTINKMREKWPKAKIVLYLWDPVVYIKGLESKLSLYDKIISFEPSDCKKYGFVFRPLFCDIDYTKKQSIQEKYIYDISFFGTMYGERFKMVYLMKEYCKAKKMQFYAFCFLRGKFMSYFYWLKEKYFRKLGLKTISYNAKSASEIANIINSSGAILDVNDILQKGLTLRTLETLLIGKKIITTNEDIINYDFYDENNICVISRNSISVPRSFLQTPYRKVDQLILDKYTVKGWVNDVLTECEK